MKKISCIVPVYNVEKHLSKCLDSILSQTFNDFEIIIIDDGSTDNSGDILDKYYNNNQQCTIIHQINKGLSQARNEGLKYAKGEYILFLDSDDWIEKNMLELLYNKAIENNDDITICGIYIEQISLGKTISIQPSSDSFTTSTDNIGQTFIELQKKGIGNMVWNKLYKRAFLEKYKILFQDYMPCEDIIFNYICFSKANHISVIKNSLYHYRKEEQNSLVTRFVKNLQEIYNIRNQYRNLFFTHFNLYTKENQAFIYQENWNDKFLLIINAYKRGSTYTFKQKKELIKKQIKDDIQFQQSIKDCKYPSKDKLSHFIRKIFILLSPSQIAVTLNFLFFVRQKMAFIYHLLLKI